FAGRFTPSPQAERGNGGEEGSVRCPTLTPSPLAGRGIVRSKMTDNKKPAGPNECRIRTLKLLMVISLREPVAARNTYQGKTFRPDNVAASVAWRDPVTIPHRPRARKK